MEPNPEVQSEGTLSQDGEPSPNAEPKPESASEVVADEQATKEPRQEAQIADEGSSERGPDVTEPVQDGGSEVTEPAQDGGSESMSPEAVEPAQDGGSEGVVERMPEATEPAQDGGAESMPEVSEAPQGEMAPESKEAIPEGSTSDSNAQGPSFLWARHAGSTGADGVLSAAVDGQGNVFIVGSISATVSFGTTSLTSKGGVDAFVAKLDSAGNWLWAKRAGSTGTDIANGVAVDSQGNVFVVGIFAATADFGTTNLTSKGGSDAFVAKLDSAGNWQWAKRAGSNSNDRGSGVTVDSQGNVLFTGAFVAVADFGTTNLSNRGGFDTFVAKLDTTGKWLWVKASGGSGGESAFGLRTDAQNNVFIAGEFDGAASFGTTNLTSKGSKDVFVAKLDSTGNWQWAKRAGSTDSDGSNGIALNRQGQVIIVGTFSATADFGTNSLTSKGGGDVFVAKLDSAGNWQWATRAGSAAGDVTFGVALDAQDNVFITGYFQSTADFGASTISTQSVLETFVAKLNTSGIWQWAQPIPSTISGLGSGIAADAQGDVFVAGFFAGAATFGTTSLSSNGSNDIFVTKIRP